MFKYFDFLNYELKESIIKKHRNKKNKQCISIYVLNQINNK
jgi:hypothetical protein